MKNCNYCGAELTDEAKFCANCGASASAVNDNQINYQSSPAPGVQQNVQQPVFQNNSAPIVKQTSPVFCILALVFAILTSVLVIPSIVTGFILIINIITAICAITFSIISLCRDNKRGYKVMSIIALVMTIVIPILEFVVLFIIGMAILAFLPDIVPPDSTYNSVTMIVNFFKTF